MRLDICSLDIFVARSSYLIFPLVFRSKIGNHPKTVENENWVARPSNQYIQTRNIKARHKISIFHEDISYNIIFP